MKHDKTHRHTSPELTEDEQDRIREVFLEEIVPKLARLQARNGVVGCEFAGPQYENWQVQFRSSGDGFEIVDFEYDEEGGGFDLEL